MPETETTPAQELREAARSIRERAEAAAAGPWRAEMRPSSAADVVLNRHGGEVADCAYANAVHIAGMHPGVALAVADLLDKIAWMVGMDPDLAGRIGVDETLGIARAYLGTKKEPGA